MKIPQIQRILREDIPEAPSWVAKLLSPVNTFIDAINNGVNKNLTLDENLDCQIKTTEFTTASTYAASNTWNVIAFPRATKNKAIGVILLDIRVKQDYYSPITAATGVSWQESNGNIRIEFIAGLADSTPYVAKLLVF